MQFASITDGERSEILTLISRRETTAAYEKLTALMQRDPRAAWPHVALAELHFRNLWRRDVVRQWLVALRMDPTLKDDRRLANHLCQARGAKWDAAGVGELLAVLGEHAVALRAACSPTGEPISAVAAVDGSTGGAAGSEAVAGAEGAATAADASHGGDVPDGGAAER